MSIKTLPPNLIEAVKKAVSKLDPVGQADADIDNDGVPGDPNDVYLRKRRDAITKAVTKGKGKKDDEDLKEAYVKHLVGVTTTDPDHTVVSKRNEKMQKRIKVTAPDEKTAVAKAIAHYKKLGFRVHDSHYIEKLNEEVESTDKRVGFKNYKGKYVEESVEELEEKELTPAEKKKREEIVKSLKKKGDEFEDKYGERATGVMYAVATKKAKEVAEGCGEYHDDKSDKDDDDMNEGKKNDVKEQDDSVQQKINKIRKSAAVQRAAQHGRKASAETDPEKKKAHLDRAQDERQKAAKLD